jgi:hypothetical protein
MAFKIAGLERSMKVKKANIGPVRSSQITTVWTEGDAFIQVVKRNDPGALSAEIVPIPKARLGGAAVESFQGW